MDAIWLKVAGLSGGTVLALVVISFLRGWIVAGWLYQKEVQNGQKWEDRSLKFLETIQVQSSALKEAARTTEALANRSHHS